MSDITISPKPPSPFVEISLAGEFPFLLFPGDKIQATVLRPVDSDHVLLQFRNRQILAESRVALPRGETLSFLVQEVQPNVVLRVAPLESSREDLISLLLKKGLAAYFTAEKADGTIPLAAKAGGTRILLPELNALLQSLPNAALSPVSVFREMLEGSLQGSGLFFENRLRQLVTGGGKETLDQILSGDLKGLLMKAEGNPGTLPSSAQEPQKDLLGGVERALQKIEFFQLLNVRQEDPAANLFLHLPVWFGEHLRFVEMNLSFPRKDPSSTEKEGYSLLFLLTLPALGKMKVEARLRDKELFCRMTVSRDGVEETLLGSLPGLEDRLTRLGFRPQIQVVRETEEEINLSWVRDLEGTRDSVFTVRV